MQGKDLSNPNLIFSSPISKLLDSSNHRQSISTSVPQLNWFKKSATIQHNFTHSQGKLSWGCFRRTMSLNDRCNHSWCTTPEWQIWLPRDAMTTVIIMRWLDKSLSTTYEEWSKTLPCDEMLYSHLGRRSIPIITIIIIIIIIIIWQARGASMVGRAFVHWEGFWFHWNYKNTFWLHSRCHVYLFHLMSKACLFYCIGLNEIAINGRGGMMMMMIITIRAIEN